MTNETGGGKRRRFALGTPLHDAIAETVRTGRQGDGDRTERIALDRIQPDPLNPRQLALTEAEFALVRDAAARSDAPVMEEPTDPRAELLLGLASLAVSFKHAGVLQPIKVYRHGEAYRIAFGERRYWAARAAALPDIECRITEHKPDNLRVLQLVENLQRQDLDLAGRMRSVRDAVAELQVGDENVKPDVFAQATGMSPRSARRYLAVLRGPTDVLDTVLLGELDSVRVAERLSKISDDAVRSEALRNIRDGTSPEDAIARALARARTPNSTTSKGRPPARVVLGSTKNTQIVRLIIQRVLGDANSPDIDWSDMRAVREAWGAFLADMEKEA